MPLTPQQTWAGTSLQYKSFEKGERKGFTQSTSHRFKNEEGGGGGSKNEERERERERQTDRQTERQTDRQIQTDRKTNTY